MTNKKFIDAMQALHELGEQVAVPMKGGKSYVMVKDRIEIFRQHFGDEYGIDTNVIFNEGFDSGAPVLAKASIRHVQSAAVVASGWAVEFVGSTKLTDASPVEVAETSAIGRALACFGLHGGEYASLNEMETHERKAEFRGGKNPAANYAAPTAPKQGNGGRQLDPGLARQVERNRDQSDWYVPTDHDAFWLQPELEVEKIVNEIEGISTTHELGKYWSDLKPFVEVIKKDPVGQDVIAEIKAAFATRHNTVGAQK